MSAAAKPVPAAEAPEQPGTPAAAAAVPAGTVAESRPARRTSRSLFRIGRRAAAGRATGVLGAPLLRSHRIAVIGLNGGAGKTTTTLALGAVLARERADR
ncbi:DUF2662 domain-containing protein, partial [Streptomyces hydrogenans]